MTEVIKNCPFCGAHANEPERWSLRGKPTWEISCGWHCCSMRRGTKREVIQDWNKRVPVDEHSPAEREVTVRYVVEYDWYQHNTGDGRFGTRIDQREFNSLSEAQDLARRIAESLKRKPDEQTADGLALYRDLLYGDGYFEDGPRLSMVRTAVEKTAIPLDGTQARKQEGEAAVQADSECWYRGHDLPAIAQDP